MTKEELEKEAEEYAGTVHRYRDAQGETEQMEDVAEAWKKGYEAGRPKWHKVADGDLPKDENDVLVYSGEDWRMCVGRYSPKYKAWETGCDTIAWCEIPTYTDKE